MSYKNLWIVLFSILAISAQAQNNNTNNNDGKAPINLAPPESWEAPETFDEHEAEMLGWLDEGKDKLVYLKEPLVEQAECKTSPATEMKATLETLFDSLRYNLLPAFQALIQDYSNNVPIKSQTELLRKEFERYRQDYVTFLEASWDEQSVLPYSLANQEDPPVAGTLIEWCMPKTHPRVQHWLAMLYLGLYTVDETLGVTVPAAPKGMMQEEERAPALRTFPFIPFLPAANPQFAFWDTVFRVEAQRAMADARTRGQSAFRGIFGANPATVPVPLPAEQRAWLRSAFLNEFRNIAGSPTGFERMLEVGPNPFNTPRAANTRDISRAFQHVVSSQCRVTPSGAWVIVLSPEGWDHFSRFVDHYYARLSSRPQFSQALPIFANSAPMNGMRIGNFIIVEDLPTREAAIRNLAAQHQFELLTRTANSLAAGATTHGLTPVEEEILRRFAGQRVRGLPSGASRPLEIRLIEGLLHTEFIARAAELNGAWRGSGATVEAAVNGQLDFFILAETNLAQRTLGRSSLVPAVPGDPLTWLTPQELTSLQDLTRNMARACDVLRQAGLSTDQILHILQNADSPAHFVDLWDGRTVNELRALASQRNSPPEQWARFRNKVDLDQAINRALSNPYVRFGLNVAQSAALNSIRIWLRGGFSRTVWEEQLLPGLPFTNRNVAIALGMPQDWVDIVSGPLGGLSTAVVRDTVTSIPLMYVDQWATTRFVAAARGFGAPRVAAWLGRVHAIGVLAPFISFYYGAHTFDDLPDFARARPEEVNARTWDAIIQGAGMGIGTGAVAGGLPGAVVGGSIGAAAGGLGALASALYNERQAQLAGVVQAQRQMIAMTWRNAERFGFIREAATTITPSHLDPVVAGYFSDYYASYFLAGLRSVGGRTTLTFNWARQFFLDYESFGGRPAAVLITPMQRAWVSRVISESGVQFMSVLEKHNEARRYTRHAQQYYLNGIRFYQDGLVPLTSRGGLGPVARSELETINAGYPRDSFACSSPNSAVQAQQRTYLLQKLPLIFEKILWTEEGRNYLWRFANNIWESCLVKEEVRQIDVLSESRSAAHAGTLNMLARIYERLPSTDPRRDTARQFAMLAGGVFNGLAQFVTQDMRDLHNFIYLTHDEIENPSNERLRLGNQFRVDSTQFQNFTAGQRLIAVLGGVPQMQQAGSVSTLPSGWIYLGVVEGYHLSVTANGNGALVRRRAANGETQVQFITRDSALWTQLHNLRSTGGVVPVGGTTFGTQVAQPQMNLYGTQLLNSLFDDKTAWVNITSLAPSLQASLERPILGTATQQLTMQLSHNYAIAPALDMTSAVNELQIVLESWALEPGIAQDPVLRISFPYFMHCALRIEAQGNPLDNNIVSRARVALRAMIVWVQTGRQGPQPLMCT